jgi:DNA/RNA endonuclease G (NUC1)
VKMEQINNRLLREGSAWVKELTPSDALAFTVTATLLTVAYGYRIWAAHGIKVPTEFWYQVPQSKDGQKVLHEKRAEERNIASAFKDQVSTLDNIACKFKGN